MSDGYGSGVPQFLERGEHNEGREPSWDYYECPGCGDPIASFCDCPNEDCRWYDAEKWRKAIREAAQEHDDIYTGSLEVAP